MADNLKIFGTTYYDVPGIKAEDENGNEKVFIRPTGTKQITGNGTADVKNYESANVNVPNTYDAGDEGKVVQNGALVSQSSQNINSNGTYDTTTKNQAVVSVPNTYTAGDEGKVVNNGALVAQTSDTCTSNGVVDTTLINSLDVNVSGGQSVTLLASGSYTKTDASTTPNLNIPVSFTGTPVYLLCYADTPVSQNQSLIWGRSLNLPDQFGQTGYNAYAGNPPYMTQSYYKTATGNPAGYVGTIELRNNNTTLYCGQQGGNYPVRDNTYSWFIWGYAT